MVLGALHPPGAPPPVGFELLSVQPSLDAFARAFELVPLGQQLLNSLTIVAIAVPLTVVCASLTGFAITRLGRPWHGLAVTFTLVCLTIPASALWVPRFAVFRTLGALDTYVPLIAPALVGTSPLLVLLCYWSARGLSRDLIDAARLAGLGPIRVWWQVVLPLTRRTAMAVAALAFVAHWGNFIEPLLYLFDTAKATLPIGLSSLRQLGPTDAPVVLAGAVVATVPPVLAFAVAQRAVLDDTRRAGWVPRR
ncbi:carbohydrate ABC transporter permease [Solirubrobacter phytolaccae]|uniref:Carbohydrate ABC transporter permease n=1 Tax=Solirubrobacter phytolaccae TaxID=1404360 RepID=A0A9X3SD84_9ACTN|nr:carbohydrate ABC transporter permease [Solirubrobacter phytolaccae]MDA0183380.1 carbohydrate ABC transporter permease [Solirubrobacter phytolaccae]